MNMPHIQQNKDKLTADMLFVLKYLYSDMADAQLVRESFNIRCVVARFFAYIMNHTCCDSAYRGLTWDSSYVNANNKTIDRKHFVPDLILHDRKCRTCEDEENVCIIQFARNSKEKKSRQLLCKMTAASNPLRFWYGVFITLGTETVTLEWFKDGNLFSYETYRTDTWEDTSFIENDHTHADRRDCMLMVTRACNLNCTYCYESHKCNDKAQDMSFATAKKIILKEIDFVKNSKEFSELEISFMGGEPLMNLPLIKQIVEWLEKEPPPVPYICFSSTNGTLVKQNEDWLRKHRHSFCLGASYDGTPEMQRRNRGTSDTSIDLDLIHEIYPDKALHMTISQDTLPHLAKGILNIQRKGHKIEASLAHGINWTDFDARLYRTQLELLSKAYLEDKSIKPINLLTRPLITISDDPVKVKQEKFCGTGTHMITYDYDGTTYGCHMFTPIVLGEKAIPLDRIDYKCSDNVMDPFCRECRLKGVCPTCAGFNYRYRGSLGARDHNWCRMVLGQMFVACVFQLKRYRKDRRHTAQETSYAKYALTAYPILEELLKCENAPFVYPRQQKSIA